MRSGHLNYKLPGKAILCISLKPCLKQYSENKTFLANLVKVGSVCCKGGCPYGNYKVLGKTLTWVGGADGAGPSHVCASQVLHEELGEVPHTTALAGRELAASLGPVWVGWGGRPGGGRTSCCCLSTLFLPTVLLLLATEVQHSSWSVLAAAAGWLLCCGRLLRARPISSTTLLALWCQRVIALGIVYE